VGKAERDCRQSALRACRSVGLYPAALTEEQFLLRPCRELVQAEKLACPIGPQDYTDGLRKFREAFRQELKDRGYTDIVVYLQRLCDREPGQPDLPATWGYWCRYHADGL
jgi:hypothetical protein